MSFTCTQAQLESIYGIYGAVGTLYEVTPIVNMVPRILIAMSSGWLSVSLTDGMTESELLAVAPAAIKVQSVVL